MELIKLLLISIFVGLVWVSIDLLVAAIISAVVFSWYVLCKLTILGGKKIVYLRPLKKPL